MSAIPHPIAGLHGHDADTAAHAAHGEHHELFFMLVGGLLAMLIRWQLAWPSDPNHPVPILGKLMGWAGGVMPPDFYTMVFSMHATIMIFFVIIPLLVGTFGNY